MKVSHQLMGNFNHKIKITHKTKYINLGFVAASLEESNHSITKPLSTGSGYRHFIQTGRYNCTYRKHVSNVRSFSSLSRCFRQLYTTLTISMLSVRSCRLSFDRRRKLS